MDARRKEDAVSEELRRSPRIISLNLVSVAKVDETGVPTLDAMGRTLDISEGGIKLETFTTIPIGSEVELGIGLGEEIIHPNARVVYLEEIEEGKYIMGLNFSGLQPEELETVRSYLAHKKEPPAPQ